MEVRLMIQTTDGLREYIPEPYQADFHQSPAYSRCFAGGVGTGKTTSAAVECIKMMVKYPGCRGLVGRYTEGELRRTSWREFLQILPRPLIKSLNISKMEVVLKNKSEAIGSHLQDEEVLKSLNLGWAWVDEATEVRERIYNQLQMRCRKGFPRRLWLTTNPESRSSWVYRYFFEDPKPGHVPYGARTTDAKFLPPDYIQHLKETWDDDMVRRFIEGSWDVFEGMVFPSFRREYHVIPWEASDIPKEWPRYRGMDHGWADPAVCLFVAADRHGSLYVYDVYYKKHQTVEAICEAVKEMSRDQVFEYTVMDPSTFGRQMGTGRPISSLYIENGLPITCVKQSRVHTGIARIRHMLQKRKTLRHPVLKGEQGCQLYVCAHCIPVIKEFLSYRYPPEGGEEPTKGHDHALDSLRYLSLHGIQAAEEEKKGDWASYIEHLLSQREPERDFDRIIGNEAALERMVH